MIKGRIYLFLLKHKLKMYVLKVLSISIMR